MVESVERTKVAIACQGGGSQTAFTAGALSRILHDEDLDREYELVALSGTSGGAMCCLLAWYGLLAYAESPRKAAELLTAFWEENSAHEPWDLLVVNPFTVEMHRLVDAGLLPATPAAPGLPGQVRNRLKVMLERLVPFGRLPGLLRDHPSQPTLLCGAVDDLTGEFVVFEQACPDPEWRRVAPDMFPSVASVQTVLASAAVPPLMPAIRIGDHGVYWDGLFSQNPPVRDLVDRIHSMRPEEIWVIQIDPVTTATLPSRPVSVVDRRFELSSNLSLNAELHWIRQVNQWIHEGILPRSEFKTIKVAKIQMSPTLAGRLDVASKVDRDPAYLHELMADGERQTDAFLKDRHNPDSTCWEPTFPHRYHPAPTSDREFQQAKAG